MSNLTFVSICCLTYNHTLFIRQCIDGFIMQKTKFPFEVLIHDDASTDGTADIIREYELKYPDIIKPIYQTQNQYSKGILISRKYNYSRAKGKYIAMCEGDDYWTDPDKLQRQIDLLENNKNISLSTENGLVKNSIENTEYLFNDETKESYYTAYEMVQSRRFPTASAVFLKDYILSNTKYKLSHDTATWVFLSTKGKVHYYPIVSSVYNRGKHGIVEGTDPLKMSIMAKEWQKNIIQIIKNSSFNDNFNYTIFSENNINQYYSAFCKYSFLKNPFKKLYCILTCIKINPLIFLKKSKNKIKNYFNH